MFDIVFTDAQIKEKIFLYTCDVLNFLSGRGGGIRGGGGMPPPPQI